MPPRNVVGSARQRDDAVQIGNLATRDVETQRPHTRGGEVRDLGVSALSITHDMASARKISDRIAMLYKGKIIWAGPTKDIDSSGNAYVEQFIHGRAEGPIKMAVKA